jgi:pimeloyl-ACP methyl ester carboxylesterase
LLTRHKNAGHVANGYRPQTYRSLTSSNSKIHVFTIDYRGFGRSTGIPSEAGLIMDGVALVKYILSLGIPPDHIVLLGQSLGTQVATAVALHFADSAASTLLLPNVDTDVNLPGDFSLFAPNPEPTTFGAVILVASFPSITKLLKVYRFAGLVPVLSPLRVYPYLQSLALRFIHETWNTSDRLAALVTSATKNNRSLRIQIIHAANDRDINWRMGEENFKACVQALKDVGDGDVGFESQGDWGETIKKLAWHKNDVKVEWELLMNGGHNRIVADVPVALAVMRGLGL